MLKICSNSYFLSIYSLSFSETTQDGRIEKEQESDGYGFKENSS